MGAVITADMGLSPLQIFRIFDVCNVPSFRPNTSGTIGPSLSHIGLQISCVSMGGSRGMLYIETTSVREMWY